MIQYKCIKDIKISNGKEYIGFIKGEVYNYFSANSMGIILINKGKDVYMPYNDLGTYFIAIVVYANIPILELDCEQDNIKEITSCDREALYKFLEDQIYKEMINNLNSLYEGNQHNIYKLKLSDMIIKFINNKAEYIDSSFNLKLFSIYDLNILLQSLFNLISDFIHSKHENNDSKNNSKGMYETSGEK